MRVRHIDQVVHELRIDGVSFAVAKIPQQDFEGRERFGHIGAVPKIFDLQPLAGMQIGQRNSPSRRPALGAPIRTRGHERRPRPASAAAAASMRRRRDHARRDPRSSRPPSSASTVALGKKLNSEADAQV